MFIDLHITIIKNFFSVNFQKREAVAQMHSVKKSVLRNFTGKHLCQSLFFDKVAGPRPATLLKIRLLNRYFPVNVVEFLRTPLQNTSRRLLLCISQSYHSIFLKSIGRSDFQAYKERDLKSTTADRNSVTIFYINAIK